MTDKNDNVVSINGGKSEETGPSFDTMYTIDYTNKHSGEREVVNQVGFGQVIGDFFVVFDIEQIPQIIVPNSTINIISTEQVERNTD